MSQSTSFTSFQYQKGTLPIILSVPHGGMLLHPDIPDRTSSNMIADQMTPNAHKKAKVVNLADLFTIEIATIVADSIEEILGKRPHVVMCHLKRSATYFTLGFKLVPDVCH